MLAIGNKYYDGLIFYIPQLCMRGSFMGEKCTENGVGFECDPFDDDFSDAIYNYFGKIESLSFRRSCDKELEKVMKEFDEGKKLCRAIFTK